MSEHSHVDRETLLNEIRRLLPEPIRDETQLDGDIMLVGGHPGEVILRICGNKVSIAEYSVRWKGPHTPVIVPKQLAILNWNRLPSSTTMITLLGLISAAVKIRRAKYRRCEKCGETKPPEWMHGDEICQSNAEEHLGVVY